MRLRSLVLFAGFLAISCARREPTSPEAAGTLEIIANEAVMPAWAVPLGKELWRKSAVAPPEPGEIDFGEVVERVSHAVTRAKGEPARARSGAWKAELGGNGFRLSPFRPLSGTAVPGPAGDDEASVTFRTRSVSFGDRTVYAASRGLLRIARGNTAQALLDAGSGIVEHYETRTQGVEVTWVVPSRPMSGAIAIEAELEGLAYGGRTAGGAHFMDATGTARVRVGRAELVDADGRRWPVESTVRGSVLRYEVPDAVLAAARFPVALDPAVGPEFGLDAPVLVPSGGYSPVVAFDGTNYLVAWARGGGIVGARVAVDGTVLDPAGLLLGYGGGLGLAYARGQYLLAWSSDEGGLSRVRASRITTAGTVLDPGGIALAPPGNSVRNASVAAGTTGFLVAWTAATTDPVRAALVTDAGALAPGSPLVVAPASSDQRSARVAFDGTNFLVVWSSNEAVNWYEIVGQFVSAAGALVGSKFAISNNPSVQESPAVAFNGSSYLVVWAELAFSPGQIWGRQVQPSGTMGASFAVSSGASLPNLAFETALAASPAGSGYLVTWVDYRSGSNSDAYAARIDASGNVVDPGGIAIATGAGFSYEAPSVAVDGASALFFWSEYDSASTVLRRRLRVSDATWLDAAPVAFPLGNSQESTPDVAFSGSQYLVAWADSRDGLREAYAVRVTRDGAVLDPAGIRLSTASGSRYEPRVAGDGSEFLVVWQDTRIDSDIYGTRVGANGAVLDPGGLPISTAPSYQGSPVVAFDGTDYVVAWNDRRGGTTFDVYATRVAPSGMVLDGSGIPVSTGAQEEYSPALECTPASCLVAWQDSRSGGYGIYGARVTTAGTVLDPAGIAIAAGGAGAQRYQPHVATDGTNLLVAWPDYSTGAFDSYGSRVTGGGAILDPGGIPIATGPGHQALRGLAFDGANYLAEITSTGGAGYDVRGVEVTPAGTLVDPAGFLISGLSYGGGIAGDGARRGLATYSRFDPTPGVLASRVFARLVGLNTPPSPLGDSLVTNEDTPATVDVLANDSDADGDPLAVALLANPAHGTAAVNPDRSITYAPAPDWYGSDVFTYAVTDPLGASTSANVAVTVVAVNDAPNAVADAFTGSEDSLLVAPAPGVLANDTDPEGAALAAVQVSSPSHGTLALSADGSFTYQPAADFFGTDSFTYQADDGSALNGASSVTPVTLTITPVNDAPVAAGDAVSTGEDQPVQVLAGALLANDVDADGDPLAIVSAGGTVNGTIALVGSALTFTPAANFNGTASFTYSVSDGQAPPLGSAATVTVTVIAVNDPPAAVADPASTAEDTPAVLTFASLLANDLDADAGDSKTLTTVTQPANGTVTLGASDLTYAPAANFSGSDTFTYTMRDAAGATSSAIVTVSVSPLNDPPRAVDDAATTSEDTPLSIPAASLLVNDSDPDGNALGVASVGAAVNGTVSLAAGTLTFTPSPNFNGVATFTCTVSDGQGPPLTASATVRVTVLSVNDAPVAGPDTAATVEDTPLLLPAAFLLANDLDVDGGVLRVIAVASTPGTHGMVALEAGGTPQSISFSSFPGPDQAPGTGDDVATDPAVVCGDRVIVNTDPARSFAFLQGGVGVTFESLSFPGRGGSVVRRGCSGDHLLVSDADDVDGGGSSYSFAAVRARFVESGTAAAPVAIGVSSAVVTVADMGSTTVTFRDASGAVLDTQTVGGVSGPDIAVSFDDSAGGSRIAMVDVTGSFSVATTALAFTPPPPGVRYAPDTNFTGPASFSYTLSDGQGGSADGNITVDVSPVNDVPAIAVDSVGPAPLEEGATATASVTISDPTDGPGYGPYRIDLDWGDSTAPSSLVVAAQGTYGVTHAYADDGAYTLTASATDAVTGGGATTPASLAASVSGSLSVRNVPPSVTSVTSAPDPVDELAAVTISVAASDVPADPLDYAFDFDGNGTWDSSGASASASTAYAANGTYTAAIRVRDGDGGETVRSVAVIVRDLPPSVSAVVATPASANEGEIVTLSASAGDPAGDPLAYAWDLDGDGLFEVAAGASVTHRFPDDRPGGVPWTVSVKVTDDTGQSASGVVLVPVSNAPPVLTPIAAQIATEGALLQIATYVTDSAGSADPITWTLQAGTTAVPAGMSVSATGTVSWVPTFQQSGRAPSGRSWNVELFVSDGDGGSASASIDVRAVWQDGDADGMADTWELANGMDPTFDDSLIDADGDGVTNIDEFHDATGGPFTPAATVPASPLDGSGWIAANDVTLVTGNTTDTDTPSASLLYRFELYGDAGLSTILVAGTSASAATDTPFVADDVLDTAGNADDDPTNPHDVDLVDDSYFWWRVRASDGVHGGPWSAAQKVFYNPVNDPPTAPQISSPPDSSSVATLTPGLAVDDASDPDDATRVYVFELWDNPDLSGTLVAVSGTVGEGAFGSTKWTVLPPLAEDTPYWWRARAVDPHGAAGTSVAASFFVNLANNEPGAPILESPFVGEVVGTATPALSVANSVDPEGAALEYEFEIDTTSTFSGADRQVSGAISEDPQGTTSWMPADLVEDVTWYWRARASDGYAWSDWALGSFRVNAIDGPPTAPIPISPTGGAVVKRTGTVLLVENAFDPDGDALQYEFTVFADEALTDVVQSASGVVEGPNGRTELLLEKLGGGRTFYWTARATDLQGHAGPASAAARFGTTFARGGSGCAVGESNPAPWGSVSCGLGLLFGLLARRCGRLRGCRARARPEL